MGLIRKIHRYFALVLGLAFLTWVGSGIMMMLPEPAPDGLRTPVAFEHDFAAVTMAPAEVIRRLKERLGSDAKANRVTLRPLRDKLVFEVRVRGQPALLFDSRSGDPLEVTPAMATQIARDHLLEGAGEPSIERLDSHSLVYPWGPLPVYRIEFENGKGAIAHVALADGGVVFTSWQKRIWHFFISLHEFGPLTILFGSNDLRRQAMLLAAVLSLVIVATGYYMEFVTLTRRKKKRGADT